MCVRHCRNDHAPLDIACVAGVRRGRKEEDERVKHEKIASPSRVHFDFPPFLRPATQATLDTYHPIKSFQSSWYFTITAEIHAHSLTNFYCQYADRHMNLKFMGRVSEREPAIRQFVIVKNKLMSVFNASVLLLIMNFVMTLSK